jgi:hypothetical protein
MVLHDAAAVSRHTTIGVCAGQPVRDCGPDRLGPSTRLHGSSRAGGPDRIDPRQSLRLA